MNYHNGLNLGGEPQKNLYLQQNLKAYYSVYNLDDSFNSLMSTKIESKEDKIWKYYFTQYHENGYCKACRLTALYHRYGDMKDFETKFRYIMREGTVSSSQNMNDYLPVCEACYLIKMGMFSTESMKNKLDKIIERYKTSNTPSCMFIEAKNKRQCSNYASKSGNHPYLCNKHKSEADIEIIVSEKIDCSKNLINPSKINRFSWLNMSEQYVPMEWEPFLPTDYR